MFDVCHMGEIHFRGARAAEAIQRLVTNDIGRLADGRALYTVACLPTGGIVDDLIVYRISATHYLIVVNAGNLEKDRAWFFEHARALCDVTDASAETGLIAFQGPGAKHALQPLTKLGLGDLASFAYVDRCEIAGVQASIARTGYTGEDGFEIFCAAKDAATLWDAPARGRGAESAASRAGLGARDTLRLEARLPLYGNDLDETTTPLEAGLGWVVKLDGADFIGREALRAQRASGVQRKLCGFVMTGRGIARHGYPLFDGEGRPSGTTTSGGPAPTLGKNIGLGYLAGGARSRRRAHLGRLPGQARRRRSGQRSVLQARKSMSAQQYPDDLYYTKDHEWARLEDRDGQKFATIGVTRFAVDQLGDVTQVDLPKEGESLKQAEVVRLRRVGQGGLRICSRRCRARSSRSTRRSATRPSTSTKIRTTRAG